MGKNKQTSTFYVHLHNYVDRSQPKEDVQRASRYCYKNINTLFPDKEQAIRFCIDNLAKKNCQMATINVYSNYEHIYKITIDRRYRQRERKPKVISYD